MPKPLFRVKRYAHSKYKYLARAKVMGKWQRRYFTTESEAIAFAQDQNARAERYLNSPLSEEGRVRVPDVEGVQTATGSRGSADLSQLVVPAYTGPRIQRYFGDHWSMHLPFAYELMRELNPRVFVELGVWKGESYFTFCQSAADHLLRTRCYGIDTWRGDVHMGEHDPQIATDVAKHNCRYSSFSELKKMSFMEALPDFADGSIDLLHIDGAHTYEDVKRDFESWLPKLSPHGIILFHDVMVRDYGCRVWKLWGEIAQSEKSFVFEFGYGLGVWKKDALTSKDSELLHRLFNADTDEQKRINEHYVTAAAALALWRSSGNRVANTGMPRPLHLQVFVDQGHGFNEAASLSSTLAPSGRQTVRFEHIERLRPERGRGLRIDPVDQPAFVNISSIKIIRDADEAILYSAESAADFEQIQASEGLLKLEEEGTLLLITTDGDPQLFLPSLSLPMTEGCRLEIVLEPHPAPVSVLARQRQALEGAAGGKTAAELLSALEASQAEIGRQRQALEEAANLAAQREAEAAQQAQELRESAETAPQLQIARATLEASQAEVARQAEELRAAAEKLRVAETQVASLENAVNTWQKPFAEWETSLDPSQRELGGVTHYLKIKDAQIKTLQDAVSDAHARWTELTSDLSAERSENRKQQERSHALEAALQNAIEQARSNSIVQRSRSADLEAQVELDLEQIGALTSDVRDLTAAVDQARTQWNRAAAELQSARFQNGELQAQTELDAEQFTAVDEELRRLHAIIFEERAELDRLASDLHHAHYQNRELQAQTELDAEQIDALERARGESSARIRKIEEQALRLSAVVDLQKLTMTGLRRCNARLDRRLEKVSERFRAAARAFVKEGPEIRTMADLILEDIRRIHDPSVLWRMAKALGLLRLAHAGVPRTAEERRALARELKAGLREICRALSSPATPPEEIAAEIPRLFQLRRQTQELLQSLKLSSLVLKKSHIWNIVHWARRAPGELLGANPASALFDATWYVGQYPDVAASQRDPLTHYLRSGVGEGRNPNPILNSAWYLKQYPDVAAEGITPLEHYWHFGAAEGRNPSPLFDTEWYLAQNPDVAASGINPLQHYLAYAAEEHRAPHPLFDATWYLSQYPEVAGLNPLQHYLEWGCFHGLSPHPLFDSLWYLAGNSDVVAAGSDPFQHYLESGAAEGRDPHPIFDSKWYLAQGPNLNATRLTPLQHYVLIGAKERRSPHPMFDARWYAENFPETSECADLLTHYLTIGWRRDYKPSPYFDSQAYLKAHPDVAESGVEPLTHFVVYGRT